MIREKETYSFELYIEQDTPLLAGDTVSWLLDVIKRHNMQANKYCLVMVLNASYDTSFVIQGVDIEQLPVQVQAPFWIENPNFI